MPKRKESTAEPTHGIEINRDWCKNCGICTAYCPKGVFAEDELGRPYVAHPEKCIACGLCITRCPDFALSVKVTEEGAAKKSSRGKRK